MKKKVKRPHKKNEQGHATSYRFSIYGKDPITQLGKLYTKVWYVPPRLIGQNKDVELERQQAEITFRKEVIEISKPTFTPVQHINQNILFMDYARDWCERILIKNPESYNYYNKALDSLKLFELHFDKILIKDMNPVLIQRFYDWLCTRTYRKNIVIVKKSIQELIDKLAEQNRQFKYKTLYDGLGLTKTTLIFARRIGHRVDLQTAKRICKYFNVPVERYFDIKSENVLYSKDANSSVKRALVSILSTAKKSRIISENFATKDYTDPITGTTGTKDIYDQAEATKFVLKLLDEKDLRKKTAFAIYIYMGLRSSEVCGLEWSDIDFANKELSVNRNHGYYGKRFGARDKAPKSVTSKRTISMPQQLIDILLEYREYWNHNKTLFGDLWENTDKLMIRDDGKTRVGSTISSWLKKAQYDYGVSHIPPHALRHTNATLLLANGTDPKTLADRLGHADPSITLKVYSHFLKQSDTKAAQTINDLFAPKVTHAL